MATLTKQYRDLRGEEYSSPDKEFEIIGGFNEQAIPFLTKSLKKLEIKNS